MAGFLAPAARAATITESAKVAQLTVFRSPSCNCCGRWIEHMEAAGFQVEDNLTDDINAIKAQYGVPEDLASCHTAIADGYVIEGHVPAADVERMLAEQPDILGIAAPGMPMGSPGMEVDDRADAYTVMAFKTDGSTAPFAAHTE
ncbi:hypothetical protein C7271_12765 [filamentous cyanobacterium CCP5]|nr:hypothetical protein C7271_12765 [filamentous cyanobacterium CCP5]